MPVYCTDYGCIPTVVYHIFSKRDVMHERVQYPDTKYMNYRETAVFCSPCKPNRLLSSKTRRMYNNNLASVVHSITMSPKIFFQSCHKRRKRFVIVGCCREHTHRRMKHNTHQYRQSVFGRGAGNRIAEARQVTSQSLMLATVCS